MEIVLGEGANSSNVVNLNGIQIVRKTILSGINKEDKRKLRQGIRLLGNYLREYTIDKHRVSNSSPDELLFKEYQTLLKWEEQGIIDFKPQLKGLSIQTPYFISKDYRTLLREDSLDKKAINLLMEKYQQIREIAFSQNDINLLHSDSHLGNFLYKGNSCIPIDPGVILDTRENLKEIDIYLNLFFLFSFFKEKANKGYLEELLSQTISRFNKTERTNLKSSLNSQFYLGNNFYMVAQNVYSKILGRKCSQNIYTLENMNILRSMM